MFFPHKIISIKSTDKVLEIGPGDSPFHRSDVLLELEYDKVEDRIKQFGHTKTLVSNKQIVYYDGKSFPFADKSFDYVICSHVLEHVNDVPFFLSEIFRVGKAGYFEYPLITYDYLYNFDVHLNFLKFTGTEMLYMKKDTTTLNEFRPLQDFFLKTLENNYGDFLGKIPYSFFEGFEWNKPIPCKSTSRLDDLIDKESNMDPVSEEKAPSIRQSLKYLINAVKNRIKR